MSSPAPIAQGDLAQRPLAHLLVYVAQKELTGTLVLWPPADDIERGQDRILFQSGRIQGAFFRSGHATLQEGLGPLVERTSGAFAFYREDLVSGGDGVIHQVADTLTCLAAINRNWLRSDAKQSVLAVFDGASVRMKHGTNLSRFSFNKKESAFIQLLQAGPDTVDALMKNSGVPDVAERVLYLLGITGLIERYVPSPVARVRRVSSPSVEIPRFSSSNPPGRAASSNPPGQMISSKPPARDSMSPPTRTNPPLRASRPSFPNLNDLSAPPPPMGLAEELKDNWMTVATRAHEIEKENFFKMLMLNQNATDNDINKAYFTAIKRWHPDRLPAELGDLRPWADRIFHHLTRAKDTLLDKNKRQEHLKAIQEGGGTPEADRYVNAVVNAAMEFQKVEVLMRRKNWDAALKRLEEAMELNPDDPDFLATRAEIMLEKYAGSDAPFDEMMKATNAALRINKEHKKALLVRARIYKRQGNTEKSIRLYKKVAKDDPKNIEALREVRLANIREADKTSNTSILGKIFSKKDKRDSKKPPQ